MCAVLKLMKTTDPGEIYVCLTSVSDLRTYSSVVCMRLELHYSAYTSYSSAFRQRGENLCKISNTRDMFF